jgi:hypothetical protein
LGRVSGLVFLTVLFLVTRQRKKDFFFGALRFLFFGACEVAIDAVKVQSRHHQVQYHRQRNLKAFFCLLIVRWLLNFGFQQVVHSNVYENTAIRISPRDRQLAGEYTISRP